MLAIQRPRMGSTQPSDSSLPFGYAVDSTQDFLLDPPEPADSTILTDNDTKILSSFFDDMTADEYSMPSFGEGLNFSDAWLDLPPDLVGTATSFGSSSALPLAPGHVMSHADFPDMLSMGSNLMPPPPPPHQSHQQSHQPHQQHHQHHQQQSQQPQQSHQPQQQQHHQHQQQHHQHHQQQSHQALEQHNPAALLAAATLMQTGASSRTSTSGSGVMFNGHRDVTHTLGPPVGHLRHQPMEEFKRAPRGSVVQSNIGEEEDIGTLSDMFFAPAPGERASTQRTSNAPIDIQWGTDVRFSRSDSFVPDPKETYDALAKGQLRYMECLEQAPSTNNTRPPSPNGENTSTKGHSRKSSEVLKKEEDADAPPRKRRKSKNTKEELEDDDDENGPSTKAARKRKTKAEPASATPPAENGTASRRRKSGSGAKPPRENLSEAQKRENHIRSEQKRRTLIKEGFDDLCDLVPGLKGGGFSKSAMLTMAADWLEDMVKGNEELKAQLSALEER